MAEALQKRNEIDKSKQELDSVKETFGSWNALDYCILAKIQKVEGKYSDAKELLDLAKAWVQQNRPMHLDVLRMIDESSDFLAK